ncbi:MAG TPA: hypothetical protein VM328_04710, partial [Fimbriimonadaceae bacterium]|nr:hypothetical protein [Fimbriimonadaceae bacterium]
VPFILDGAHNAEAALALAQTLRAISPHKFVLLTGMVSGHEPESFYRPLLPLIAQAEVAPIDFHRAIPAGELAGRLRRLGLHTRPHESVAAAVEAASAEGLPVLVTGSFYLVGEVGRLIGADRA